MLYTRKDYSTKHSILCWHSYKYVVCFRSIEFTVQKCVIMLSYHWYKYSKCIWCRFVRVRFFSLNSLQFYVYSAHGYHKAVIMHSSIPFHTPSPFLPHAHHGTQRCRICTLYPQRQFRHPSHQFQIYFHCMSHYVTLIRLLYSFLKTFYSLGYYLMLETYHLES